jgi:hypothetical protein
MKTKIYLLTLMTGFVAVAMGQSSPTAGGSGSAPVQTAPAMPAQVNNGQNMPQQSPNQMNPVMPGISTNSNVNSANTNLPGGYNGNNGMTNGNGASGMNGIMETNKFNPYANYTNPNSVYVNPNSTNVNPYATYTNPYAIDASTNSSSNTNRPGGYYGNNGTTNMDNLTGITNGSTVSTNRHHWWKWW